VLPTPWKGPKLLFPSMEEALLLDLRLSQDSVFSERDSDVQFAKTTFVGFKVNHNSNYEKEVYKVRNSPPGLAFSLSEGHATKNESTFGTIYQ
jgi:hypothetical protein